MEIKIKNYVPMFQEGGEIPQEAPMEQEQTQEMDPMNQLLQGAAQALQNQDCQIAMQVCEVLMQLAQGGQQAEPTQQPVYKKGGRLSHWINK